MKRKTQAAAVNKKAKRSKIKRGDMICYSCCHWIQEKSIDDHVLVCEGEKSMKEWVEKMNGQIGESYREFCAEKGIPTTLHLNHIPSMVSKVYESQKTKEEFVDSEEDEPLQASPKSQKELDSERKQDDKKQAQLYHMMKALKMLTKDWFLDFEAEEELDDSVLTEIELQEKARDVVDV